MLLRGCTEFESLCKEGLDQLAYVPPHTGSLNINDYRWLESHLRLEGLQVGIRIWRPAPVYVTPFRDWSTSSPPLAWYKAYNQVKHNRHAQFDEASLGNVRLALSGVFLMLWAYNVIEEGRSGQLFYQDLPDDKHERWFSDYIFSIVTPKMRPPPGAPA